MNKELLKMGKLAYLLWSLSLVEALTFSPSSRLNFTAWDQRNVCYPATLQRPTTVQQVASILAATTPGGQVKTYGAGHSFSPCALTDPVSGSRKPTMLNLDHLNKVLVFPTKTNPVVRVQAGIRVHELNSELHKVGQGQGQAYGQGRGQG